MAGPRATPPLERPPHCEGENPFYFTNTEGYHKARACALWRGEDRGKSQTIVVTDVRETPKGTRPPTYVVQDSEEAYVPKQEPSVEISAFYHCGEPPSPDLQIATVHVPALPKESQDRLAFRLKEAAQRLKAVEKCVSPHFESIAFPVPVKEPHAGKGHRTR